MKTAIIYNPSSGSSATSAKELRQLFGPAGKDLILFDISQGLTKIGREINNQNIELVVAAGGDGTVNAVAQLATSASLPMGVLPAGTLNHFAKDLGLPMKLQEAAKVILAGNFKKIDYCTVNNQVFVNNSSIGLYPAVVHERENLEPKMNKWPAALIAFIKVGIRVSSTHLTFRFDGQQKQFKTPLVFIGNNSYQPDKIGFTNRATLADGNLFIYIVRANKLSALIRQTILIFWGKRFKDKDFVVLTKKDLIISSRQQQLKVAVDGEVLTLQSPLTYKQYRCALTVVVPK